MQRLVWTLLFFALAAGSQTASAQLSLSFEGKQLASDGSAGDQFGHGVAVSGDTAVIGAQVADGAVPASGAAYVLVRSGTIWTEQQKLFAADGALDDTYGVHVAIDGETIVVGARFDDDNGSNSGSAYVYTRSGTTWTQEAKLTASDGDIDDAFGRRVSISGDTIIVGANGDDDVGLSAGSAYVFVRSGTIWTEEAKLTASDAAAGNRFGIDVAVSGDTAVVGALSGDGSAIDSGTVYIFDRTGTLWSQTTEIFASDAATGDSFGRSVAFDGASIAIGAQSDDDNGSSSGSAYVFVFNGLIWSQQQKLVPADNSAGDLFGTSVTVDGDLCVVGAQQGDGVFMNSGSAYVYSRSSGIWSAEGELFAGAAAGDDYGFAVCLNDDGLVISATEDDDLGLSSGSAYMYRLIFTGQVSATLDDVTALKGLSAYDASAGDVHAPGAVFTDLTQDGFPDLYLMRNGENELYVNVDDMMGGRTFVQVPSNGGAGNTFASQGAVAADYDNDGDADIYLINWRADNALYKNMWAEDHAEVPAVSQTELRFVNVTALTDPTPMVADDQHGVGTATYDNTAMGLGNDTLHNSLTAAWADVNRDGHLDLFHGSHDGLAGNPLSAEDDELGERDTMYLNMGDGTFMDITMSPPWTVPSWEPITGFEDALGACCDTNLANPQTPREFGCTNAATFADFNNDGWPDLVVTNKSGSQIDRDMLYLNLGLLPDGNWAGFEQVSHTLPLGNGGTIGFGTFTGTDMGIIAGDLDNDGDLDAYASLGSVNPTFCDNGEIDGDNVLWINQLVESGGTLSFNQDKDILEAVWSWGVNFVDLDNNGWLDAHAVTEIDARSFLYMQTSDLSFVEYSKEAGVDQCSNLPRSFGNPSADYNQDGWMDLFVVNEDSTIAGSSVSSALFENNSALGNPDHHYLALTLVGNPNIGGTIRSTRDAIGARVYVTADLDDSSTIDPGETMMREVTSGSGNTGSTCSLQLHFGLGMATMADVRVQWPSGRVTRATLAADQILSLNEGNSRPLGIHKDRNGGMTPVGAMK